MARCTQTGEQRQWYVMSWATVMRYLLRQLGCLLCSAKCCGINRDKRTEIPIIAWYGAVSFLTCSFTCGDKCSGQREVIITYSGSRVSFENGITRWATCILIVNIRITNLEENFDHVLLKGIRHGSRWYRKIYRWLVLNTKSSAKILSVPNTSHQITS